MLNRFREMLQKGMLHIVGSNAVNKAIVFFTNIALVRILSKSAFGVFTSAFNVFSVVFLFSGLGISNGMLYFCSQKRSEASKKAYYAFCFRCGNIVNLVLGLIILLYGRFATIGIQESRPYIICLSGMPLAGFWYDYYSIILRTQKQNKKYSLLMNVNTLLYAGFAVIGSWVAGVYGTIVGRYLAYIASAVVGYFFSKPYLYAHGETVEYPRAQDRPALFSYSIKAGMTSALNNILYLIDIYVIGIVVADASILASYKVGAQIPENMNFIPQSMMVFFLPYFIEHATEASWIRAKAKELYLLMAGVSFAISAVLIAIAPFVVTLLWGQQYADAVPCFRILTLSFFFLSTFRLTSTNILLSIGKAGYTLAVSIISGVANIALDVLMTVRFGSIGAAYATLLVTVIASALSFPYVVYSINRVNRGSN